MKLLLASAAIAALAFAAQPAAQRRGRLPQRPAAKTQSATITFQGRERRYLVHVPDAPGGALVLAFHGGGETPRINN